MSSEFLTRLFWACSDETRRFREGSNLCELYQRLTEADKADASFTASLKEAKLTADTRETLESDFNDACWSYEQQGFINGFRIGLMMAREMGL